MGMGPAFSGHAAQVSSEKDSFAKNTMTAKAKAVFTIRYCFL
jgi:hypothetical protein